MTRTTELTPLLKSLKLGGHGRHPARAHRPGPSGATGLRLILGDRPQRRGQPPRPPAHRTPAPGRRFRGDLPTAGLRLVSVNYPGSSSAGRRLFPGVSRQARARAAGRTSRRRQELPRSSAGLFRHSRADTPSASTTPTTSSRPWHRPGWTTPSTAPSGPSSPPTCSSWMTSASTGSPPSSPPISTNSSSTATGRSSFIITSNRAVEEWLSLFDDPILGNSALDRLANASYQIVIDGTSYRERLSPHRALLSTEGGD